MNDRQLLARTNIKHLLRALHRLSAQDHIGTIEYLDRYTNINRVLHDELWYLVGDRTDD